MNETWCVNAAYPFIVGNDKKMKIILLILLAYSFSPTFSQAKTDSIDLKSFWSESVEPLIIKDFEKIKTIVHFPLEGEWGFMMGLKKDELDWTQVDFIENYDKLFDDKTIGLLKELNYTDAELFNHEILVGIGWKDESEISESGIIFRFKEVNGQWRLCVIQGVG
jgi:hypothetical protein